MCLTDPCVSHRDIPPVPPQKEPHFLLPLSQPWRSRNLILEHPSGGEDGCFPSTCTVFNSCGGVFSAGHEPAAPVPYRKNWNNWASHSDVRVVSLSKALSFPPNPKGGIPDVLEGGPIIPILRQVIWHTQKIALAAHHPFKVLGRWKNHEP